MTTDRPLYLIDLYVMEYDPAASGTLSPVDAVTCARAIATAAHAWEVDEMGGAYVAHVAHVAAGFGDATAVAVAWLHDVLGGAVVTLADLRRLFPAEIVDAVDALTRRPHETEDEYGTRIRRNRLAADFKIACLRERLIQGLGDGSNPCSCA
ncbi:hypothetical protein PXH69_21655 [Rhodococcus qingshengii]|uniref:Phosphohydrolase n=1 Tax=Rhodococcus qingshengii TaxID=334542 RepID=A0AAW6LKS7_RHOSG|nr:hypothetical protein [Rhodococcus qingshengii]MDE8647584.1 hypothetical protein [Rhodococcus qingshengii]